MLFNQVLPVLGPNTPVNRLEWSNGGRQQVLSLKKSIEERGSLYQSDNCLMVMRGMFDYAIDRGWMQPPNPAMGSKQAKSKHKPRPNPSLEWGQVPRFFEDLERNEPGASLVTLLAVKVLVMTILRGGSLTLARFLWSQKDPTEVLEEYLFQLESWSPVVLFGTPLKEYPLGVKLSHLLHVQAF